MGFRDRVQIVNLALSINFPFQRDESKQNTNLYCFCQYYIQGVTEMQVQNWTMPIKTKNKTFYKNDKKRLTA